MKLSDEQINNIKSATGIQQVEIVGYDKYGGFNRERVGEGQLVVFNNNK